MTTELGAERARAPENDPAAKIEILERHVDHLMSQLYHQIELIRFHKERGDHFAAQVAKIEHLPKELDETARRIVGLREQIAGQKEVELDLRRRIEALEAEEQQTSDHLARVTRELERVWNSPWHRLWRQLKRPFVWLTGHSEDAKRSGGAGP